MRVHFSFAALWLMALTVGSGSAGRADTLLASPLVTTVGPGTATSTAITSAPNNYPTPNPSNLVIGVTLNVQAAPLDLVLAGVNSGGTTAYLFTDTIANSTATTFTGYNFQLGTGTGANFRVLPTGGTSEFFFSSPVPTSNRFSTSSLSPESLTFSNGTIAPGGIGSFTFALATPDQATTPNTFTLRETPIVAQAPPPPDVPEPGSIALLAGMGTVGAAFLRRRKQARN